MGFVIIGALFLLIETWYFGWNTIAQSNAERVCDSLGVGMVFFGLTCMVFTWARRIEKKIDAISERNNDVKTKQ